MPDWDRNPKDYRTKREKIQALADNEGATEGERAAARAALDRMGPAPAIKDNARPIGDFGATPFTDAFREGFRRHAERTAEEAKQQTNRRAWSDMFGSNSRTHTSSGSYSAGSFNDNFFWREPDPDLGFTGGDSSTEQLRKKLEEELERMTAQEIIDLLGGRRGQTYSYTQETQHNLTGEHIWADVGTGIDLKPIRRCIVCQEYEKKGGVKRHKHDWYSTTTLEAAHGESTQACRGCTLRRKGSGEGTAWRYFDGPRE